jgi:Delta7-sterol 5-desaturase
MPTREMLWDHLVHGQSALFSYALLPMFSSFLSERKLNLTYGRVSDVGWPTYCLYTFVYFWLVEFAVYFVHRNLHTVKFLYNHVHLMHHKYNKPEEVRGPCEKG